MPGCVEAASEGGKPGLLVTLPLAGEGNSVRVLLTEADVRYLVEQQGEWFAADLDDPLIDRGVYRLMAELARDG